jgi:adenylylsulfate kinase
MGRPRTRRSERELVRYTHESEGKMSGMVIWFTGLPSSGKSRFAERVQLELNERGRACCLLDGDKIRSLLHPQPGYSRAERDNFYLTLGNLAAELAHQGLIVLVAATASRRAYREHARAHVRHFIEVWLDAGVEECRKRDSKGLYAGFASGNVHGMPGEDQPYEAPESPDVRASGAHDDEALARLLSRLSYNQLT